MSYRLPGALLAFTAAMVGGAVLAAGTPQSVGIHKSDVPKGYTLVATGTLNNGQMAVAVHVPKSQFDRHGRVTGVELQFRGTGAKKLDQVYAFISKYRTPAGAAWDYALSTSTDLKHSRRTSIPRIGAASTGFFSGAQQGTHMMVGYGIDFHDGLYDVTVGVDGLLNSVKASDSLRYARLIDRRIRAQH